MINYPVYSCIIACHTESATIIELVLPTSACHQKIIANLPKLIPKLHLGITMGLPWDYHGIPMGPWGFHGAMPSLVSPQQSEAASAAKLELKLTGAWTKARFARN